MLQYDRNMVLSAFSECFFLLFTSEIDEYLCETSMNHTPSSNQLQHMYLLQGGLADTVVNDAQSLLVALQLAEYRGPGQACTRQLVGH